MAISSLYSPKQTEVLAFAFSHDFYMLINHGAKRSGKTIVDNDIFLAELRRVRRIADAEHVKHPQYILAGADLASLQRNVLTEITNRYGITFKFDKANRFELFGVRVCCFGHSKINDLGRIRGMTAYGAYINEASVANEEVFNEIKSRCSATGARIILDTNPDRPSHWLKKDYIDKADGATIKAFSWKLTDNTFLSDRYIADTRATTPSGMFYDRDINGAWVAANGIVYPDFEPIRNYVYEREVPPIVFHWVGVDFGWQHPGCFVLMGRGTDGKTYLLKEWTAQFRSIQDWISIGKDITAKHGNCLFYCDSARPDLIDEMLRAGLRAVEARKDVLAGIAQVATEFKTGELLVVREGVDKFTEEIETYAWKDNADEPVKTGDDVMDALRYAVMTEREYGNR
jgi:PBSX family phage terminase large subunit